MLHRLCAEVIRLTKLIFSHLGDHFEASLRGDGVDASAILLGCDCLEYEANNQVKSVYRRLTKTKFDSGQTHNAVSKIVILASKFIYNIFEDHNLLDEGSLRDL